MPFERPTQDDLKRYAGQLHFRADGDLSDLETLVEGILECADRIEAEPEPEFEMHEVRYPRLEPGRRPTQDENPYNAWVTRCLVKGASDGTLSGKTVGLKDNVALADVEMTCGSKVLEGYVPKFDATIVHRLLDAGAEIIGKLNMESFAFSGSSETSDFGEVPTPLNTDHLAGGSSSGSGAAPAAGDCDISIGGDQGGSIRVPSAWCGLVGIKPTSGLVPYTGVFAIDMSIDHTGPQARTVEDAAATLQVIAGEDVQNGIKMDPRQPAGVKAGDYTGVLGKGIKDLKVGWLREGIGWEFSDAAVDDAFRAALDALGELGAQVTEVSVPQHRISLDLWTTLAVPGAIDLLEFEAVGTNFDGWYNTDLLPQFARLRRERGQLYPPTVKSAGLAALHMREPVGGLHYARSQNIALGLRRAYNRLLEDADILVMPTTPMLPYRADPDLSVVDRVGRTLTMLANTANFDLTAHPALTVPCKLTPESLPVGLMIVGRHFDEETLFRTAHAFEQQQDWRTR
jgi:amidase